MMSVKKTILNLIILLLAGLLAKSQQVNSLNGVQSSVNNEYSIIDSKTDTSNLRSNKVDEVFLQESKEEVEEMIAKGKAYVDETFPNCDFDYLYPHCVLDKGSYESKEELTKDSWAEIYPWEYELYIYYNNKLNELSLSLEEIELRKQNAEKDRKEKEKYFYEKQN